MTEYVALLLEALQARVHVVDVAGDLAQVVIEPSGIEAAAQHVIAQLQRIVVGIEAVEVQLLGQGDGILHPLRIGHIRWPKVC